MKPFLKWAGGKRWLAQSFSDFLPNSYESYIEPFLGSGAIFFAIEPKNAVLSDVNEELIHTYTTIRDFPNEINVALSDMQRSHSKDYYYEVRRALPHESVAKAARFIYLNRTCWNGLYRVNKRNEFNVPKGTKDSVLLDYDDFISVSKLLMRCEISACDFQKTIDSASQNDLIYVDPPYTVKHNNNGFVKYNQQIFSWDDQVRLRDALENAAARGCHVVVSNANHESVRDIYRDFGVKVSMPRASVIAGTSAHRGATTELVVVRHSNAVSKRRLVI